RTTRPRAAPRPPDGLGAALRRAHPHGRSRRLCRAGPARASQQGTRHASYESSGLGPRDPGGAAVPLRHRARPGPDSPAAVAANCPDARLAAATPRLAGAPATDLTQWAAGTERLSPWPLAGAKTGCFLITYVGDGCQHGNAASCSDH